LWRARPRKTRRCHMGRTCNMGRRCNVRRRGTRRGCSQSGRRGSDVRRGSRETGCRDRGRGDTGRGGRCGDARGSGRSASAVFELLRRRRRQESRGKENKRSEDTQIDRTHSANSYRPYVTLQRAVWTPGFKVRQRKVREWTEWLPLCRRKRRPRGSRLHRAPVRRRRGGHVPGIDDRQRRLACAGRVHEFRLSNLCTNASHCGFSNGNTSFNAASSSSPSLCRSMRRARCSMTKTMRKAAGKSSTLTASADASQRPL
jgi:hypothetical protein